MKIICFDVDMTLYDHNSRIIPESALKTIEVLRRDHKILLTTGRDLGDDYCKTILEQVRPDAMVHCNGTRVSVGEEILLDKGFPLEFVKEIFDYALEQGFTVGALYDEKAFCTNIDLCHEPLKKFCDGVGLEIRDYSEVDIDPVFEMFYYGSEKEARQIEARFPELRLPMYATGNASDIIFKGYSKATGVQMVLDYFGKTFEDVIAVGDSNNDLELVKEAGYGICMGNGSDALKAVADDVTAPIWDDGVYKAFKKLGMVE